MFRKLATTVVLLGFILPLQTPKIQTTNPNTEYKLYLPQTIYTFPSVDVSISGYPNGGGHLDHWYCVYGYTTALTTTQVYSVTLAVDMVFWDNTYHHTEYISPTLDATLPDQKNPFYHCAHCTIGACEDKPKPDGVKLASASLIPPNGRVIYPLTVITWSRKVDEDGYDYIQGEVRNDSGHRLVDIRVVGILSEGLEFWEYNRCEAVLETTTLNPGKKTDFYLDYDYFCVRDVSEFSAQGVADP